MLDKKSHQLINAVIYKEGLNNSKELLSLAQNNRVLYSLSLKNNDLIDIQRVGEDWIKKLSQTIKFTKESLGEIPYLITRTYKYTPYVTFDIDLFVKSSDYEKVIGIFKKSGCKIKSHDTSLGGRFPNMQKNIFKKDLLAIDLHRDFTWQKTRFLDVSLLFKEVKKKNIAGITTDIPNSEVEFLLCMADISHERFNITLLDIIWLKGLAEEIIDWDLIYDQVRKFGWEKTFYSLSRLINELSEDIFNKKILENVDSSKGNLSLPYFLPIRLCLLSYFENMIHNKSFPLVSFVYMCYCRFRYYLIGQMPYYNDWYIVGKS